VESVFVLRRGGATEAGAMICGMGGCAALLAWPVAEGDAARLAEAPGYGDVVDENDCEFA